MNPFAWQDRLERLGLHGSRIGFGSAPIGGLYGPVPEETALDTARAAFAAGIRVFDTAPGYSLGLSETRLGLALRGLPRDELLLESKVGRVLEQGRLRFDFSERGLEASLESSLERLGAQSLDVALLHDPDDFEDAALKTAFPTLLRWREQGLVRAIGVGMNQWAMPLRFLERVDLDVIMLAGRYTLLEQGGWPLLQACAERGVAVFAAGVFNSGILAGGPTKYDYGDPPAWVKVKLRALRAAAVTHETPLAAAAIQFVLAHPAVACAVLGASHPDEVRANERSASWPIPPEFWRSLVLAGLLPDFVPTPA